MKTPSATTLYNNRPSYWLFVIVVFFLQSYWSLIVLLVRVCTGSYYLDQNLKLTYTGGDQTPGPDRVKSVFHTENVVLGLQLG